MEEAEGFKFYT